MCHELGTSNYMILICPGEKWIFHYEMQLEVDSSLTRQSTMVCQFNIMTETDLFL